MGTGQPPACSPSNAATATYSTANKVTWTTVNGAVNGFTYGAAGNVLFDGANYYSYDAESRVCAVETQSYDSPVVAYGYIYDAEGRRVAKGSITPSAWGTLPSCNLATNGFTLTESYVLGQGGEELTNLTWSGSTSTWARTNVYGGGKLLATYDTAGLHFHLTDPLGSRRVQTSAAGIPELDCQSLPYGDQQYCYPDPYAQDATDDATPLHFTGKERDTESGNDYFGARYYGSSMGRFMSPDPVKFTDERLLNPADTLNLYSYAGNNPLKFVDPDGQDVTYFYDQGGIAGHAVLFAYNQQTGDSAIESFGPVVHAPIAPSESMFDMSSLHSADDVRSTYASLTIQTSPELAQQVIAYIRANPDPSTWTAIGPNCSTRCLKILQKFKLANQKASGLRPKLLWNSLKQQ